MNMGMTTLEAVSGFLPNKTCLHCITYVKLRNAHKTSRVLSYP